MANGKTHILWWKRVIPFSTIVSLILMFISPIFAIMFLIGYLIGEPYLSADLDHLNMTSSEYRIMRQFGCLGAIWVACWTPYAFMMPHRSFLSHFPVVSDLFRLFYILLVPAILWWYMQMPVNNTMLLGLGGLVAGLSLSTTVHYILDM